MFALKVTYIKHFCKHTFEKAFKNRYLHKKYLFIALQIIGTTDHAEASHIGH